MSTNPTTSGFPSFAGGIPTRDQDLAASIIFCLAYAILVGLSSWRLISSTFRSWILVRPSVFVVVQAVAYALRAVIANGNQDRTIFIISEIFLLAGLTLICEPIAALLVRVLGKKGDGISRVNHRPLEQSILTLVRIAILVALILGIMSSTKISDHETAAEIASSKTYRLASASLIIAAMVASSLIAISIVRAGLLGHRSVAFIVVQTTLLVASAAYKLASTIHPSDNFSASGKVVYYIFNGAAQWLVAVLYFTFNLNDLFVDQNNQNARSQVSEASNKV